MTASRPGTTLLGGLPITVADRAEAADALLSAALARRDPATPPVFLTSADAAILSRCARDPAVASLFAAADAIYADATPMVLASRLLCRQALPGRVSTPDLFHDVARLAAQRGASFFLLGARFASLARAERAVRRRHPDLALVGTRHGFFAPDEEDEVVRQVNAARPDILWLGMGAPRDQAFAVRNRDRLTGVGAIRTAGSLFDALSGDRARPAGEPPAAGNGRQKVEPRRLLRHYAVTNPHALFLLATRSA